MIYSLFPNHSNYYGMNFFYYYSGTAVPHAEMVYNSYCKMPYAETAPSRGALHEQGDRSGTASYTFRASYQSGPVRSLAALPLSTCNPLKPLHCFTFFTQTLAFSPCPSLSNRQRPSRYSATGPWIQKKVSGTSLAWTCGHWLTSR